jgi:hypothetical protein
MVQMRNIRELPLKCANILNIKKPFFPLENSKKVSKEMPIGAKDKVMPKDKTNEKGSKIN